MLPPLFGVPVALKDLVNMIGTPTTAGSKILEGYVSPYDATIAVKLKAAGALILGKTNMDEFAMGSSTEFSAYKRTVNPWDRERVPGGSSGGSASAVAALHAPLSIGSDTGGSIRQPASLTGITGMKPTYGRVSRYGIVAFASSLDQIGPFARSAQDAALLLHAIAGSDPRDATSSATPVDAALLKLPQGDQAASALKGKRFALPKEYFVAGMEPGVEAAVRAQWPRFSQPARSSMR
jgi:aspartyl-tRNA(Asn)/glutamyl-tRNA(Gln) amidotransferase subunit A